MVFTSSPVFSRERNASHGGGISNCRDGCNDWDRPYKNDRPYDRDRSRNRDRSRDRDRPHNRDTSRPVRVVSKGDVLPAIIATGIIAGITFSLLDNDNAPAPQPVAPRTCAPMVSQSATAGSVVVTAALLNVRSGPGLNQPPIHQVPRGARLSIIGTSAGWYHVLTSGGVSGWVMAQYTTSMGISGHG
jgi:hypothetical protein